MLSNFNLSSHLFSETFWNGVFSDSDHFEYLKLDFLKDSLQLESLRKNAKYNTGSISAASAWIIFLLCRYFKVQ